MSPSSTGTTSTATGTQAIDRAALLVATVVKADEPMSFLELHEECDLPRSTTSRLLAALERTQLLERHEDGGYVAGPLFWLYATRHDPWDELVRMAMPVLDAVGEITRETVNLSVSRSDRVVQVAQVDSTYRLSARDWSEIDVAAHCSAVGKVLMAYGAVRAPARLEQVTPNSVTERTTLERQLSGVLRNGYATTADELEVGLSAVAVPVRGVEGQVVAALGVSGPSPRLEGRFDEIGRLLIDRAARLSSSLRRGTRKDVDGEGVAS